MKKKILNKTQPLIDALQSIVNWELPETGEFWDRERKNPLSYGAKWGSNGERDYFKNLARNAIINHTLKTDRKIDREVELEDQVAEYIGKYRLSESMTNHRIARHIIELIKST